MTLPQAAWDRTFLGRPSQVFNASMRRGNTVRIKRLKLDLVVYETGGFPLNFHNTGLNRVFDVTQLLGVDPDNKAIQNNPVRPVITFDGSGAAKLQLYVNGAEVANGWSGTAGHYIWLSFTGVA